MRKIGTRRFATLVLVATLYGCSGAPDATPIPAAGNAAINCRGVSRMPDVSGFPTATFKTSLRLTAPQDAADSVARSPDSGAAPATFHLRVDLPEESQHSDLPVGDPYVARVFPVVKVESDYEHMSTGTALDWEGPAVPYSTKCRIDVEVRGATGVLLASQSQTVTTPQAK